MELKNYDIVLFHYPCQDGLASGWVANYYHKIINMQIELYPVQHNHTIDINRLHNKSVLFCDYSPSLEILNLIENVAKKITILDHHISAKKALENKSYAIFDMNKSGAGLTWEYFFPDSNVPTFIQMIQDRDLWKWEISNSKEFTSGLFTLCDGYESYNFTELFNLIEDIYFSEDKFNFCLDLGKVISRANHNKAKSIADSASKKIDNYKGHKVCVVNCSYEHASEVGNLLSSMNSIDFAVMWTYNNLNDNYHISLRSCNKVDVSQIASEYGGGGHVNASGMTTKIFPPALFSEPAN